MGFLDELSRKLAEGVDRARFEAEKFQRVTAIQGEISTLRRQIDGKRLEFGDRALELFKAGAIQSPTLAAILREIEALQASLTLKEEELRHVQGQVFIEPTTTRAQNVPISVEPPRPPAPPVAGSKTCPSCGFQMPQTAVFCPNCGLRIG